MIATEEDNPKDPSANMTPVSSPGAAKEDLTLSARRSSRAKKSVRKFEDEDFTGPITSTPTRHASRPERDTHPKRKAAVVAEQTPVIEDGSILVEQILSRMTPDECKEYGGWVELESEPVGQRLFDSGANSCLH